MQFPVHLLCLLATIQTPHSLYTEQSCCGHKKFDLGIAWAGKGAKGIGSSDAERAVDGSWFAGAKLNSRCCSGDCSHETFYFPRKLKKDEEPLEPIRYYDMNGKAVKRTEDVGKYFDFTKTAYKPYDLAVNIALIIIKHHLGKKIKVSSDGELEHWQDAMELTQTVLGYGKNFKLEE